MRRQKNIKDCWFFLFNFLLIRWEEEKEEFGEFQCNSKELETELETQLELLEKNNAELQAKVERLSIEVETNKAGVVLYCP